MSEISNKAILIAVSLLVTIAITSSIMMVIGFFKDIYSDVEKTDISIRKSFNEFDKYDNTILTGIDILNGYNKYKENPLVSFTVDGRKLENSTVETIINEKKYAFKYDSKCTRVGDGAVIECVKIDN